VKAVEEHIRLGTSGLASRPKKKLSPSGLVGRPKKKNEEKNTQAGPVQFWLAHAHPLPQQPELHSLRYQHALRGWG
jgi:hypothetical protein